MKFSFFKMHGAGNKFIIIDDRSLKFPRISKKLINHLKNNYVDLNFDGIILFQTSKIADVKMVFYNPDGSEANMCGNGARCVAKLYNYFNNLKKNLVIETNIGLIKSFVKNDIVKLFLDINPSIKLSINLGSHTIDYCDSGVPHTVKWLQKSEKNIFSSTKFLEMGRFVRYHEYFKPNGTNFNLVITESKNIFSMRTYERGVEDETSACGTGALAIACLAVEKGICNFPVTIKCNSKEELLVDKESKLLTLEGSSIIEYNDIIDI